MKTYRLTDVFATIQGEGAQHGRACVFVRFAGCDARCTFCDTDFATVRYSLTLEELVEKILTYQIPSVVFTGGEPALQLDKELVIALHFHGIWCAIETRGGKDVSNLGLDWICVSPKSLTGGVISDEGWKQRTGNEVKVIYPGAFNPALFLEVLDGGEAFEHYWVSPCDGPQREANTSAAIAFCLRHPRWKLSCQLHKLIGIP